MGKVQPVEDGCDSGEGQFSVDVIKQTARESAEPVFCPRGQNDDGRCDPSRFSACIAPRVSRLLGLTVGPLPATVDCDRPQCAVPLVPRSD